MGRMKSGTYTDVPQVEQLSDRSPLGTILAWVPHPEVSLANEDLPEGWLRCNGSTITKGPWAGGKTPDLNGEKRFLRGASDSEVLSMEEDQMQDHKHQVSDPGHTHGYIDSHYGTPSNGAEGPTVADRVYDRWDHAYSSTTASRLTGLAVQGVSTGRHGSETRPK